MLPGGSPLDEFTLLVFSTGSNVKYGSVNGAFKLISYNESDLGVLEAGHLTVSNYC